MKERIPPFLLGRPAAAVEAVRGRRRSTPFLERAAGHLSGLIRNAYAQWDLASRVGLFQRLDARVKVLFLAAMVVLISFKRDLVSEIVVGIFLLVLVVAARIGVVRLYRSVLLLGFFFGFLVTLPSALNLVAPGEVLVPILRLPRPYDFLSYHIPETIGVTREGLTGVFMITLRVVNSLTTTFLVLHTTPFNELIRALRVFRVPDTMLMVFALTYKYLFVFVRTTEEMHLARKARVAGTVRGSDNRRWLAGRMAFVFRKTQLKCEEVFKAMLGRGFSGRIQVHGFRPMTRLDWTVGAALALAAAGLFLM